MGANNKPKVSLRKPPEAPPFDPAERWVSGVAKPSERVAEGAEAEPLEEPRQVVFEEPREIVHAQQIVIDHGSERPTAELHAVMPDEALKSTETERSIARVSGPSSARASGRSNASKGKRSSGGGRSLVKRADGRELTRLQVYLEPALAKRLKRHCVDADVDMTSFVRALIEKAV